MAGRQRYDITKTMPEAYQAFVGIENMVKASSFDPILKHLIKLRVSQINGCAYCVRMHTAEAREDNETQERLDHLPVWQHVAHFTGAEKAALAWAEAMTTKGHSASLGDLHSELEKHFDHDNIALLSLVIIMINSWNRLKISAEHDFF
jgi:AhpD family alkylhydroperoxidase